MDYNLLLSEINDICDGCNALSVNGIGESIMGRGIHSITLGQGQKQIVFIGAQSGCDGAVSFAMLHFVREYSSLLQSQAKLFGLPLEYIDKKLSIILIPMLNPDGVEYFSHGVNDDNPIKERLFKMNGGSVDFSQWQANGRGVDIGRNYNCGYEEYKASTTIQNGAPIGYSGEAAESEPETGHLCNYLRYSQNIKGIIQLCGRANGVTYCGEKNRKSAMVLSDMLGGASVTEAELCSLQGWCCSELEIPAFSVGCGIRNGDSPFIIYTKLRKLLFCAPMLF